MKYFHACYYSHTATFKNGIENVIIFIMEPLWLAYLLSVYSIASCFAEDLTFLLDVFPREAIPDKVVLQENAT